MSHKSPAKLLRSVKRMTKFIEKKTTALAIVQSLEMIPLAKTDTDEPQQLDVHQPGDEPQPVDEPQPQEVITSPEPPNTEPLYLEPTNPEPPDDDDVLTKEDFYKIMENFKKESLDLFKLKLTAQFS